MIAEVTEPRNLDDDQHGAIVALSEKLHLPLSEVRKAYLQELDRLKSQARIHNFVEVLAVSSARSALLSGRHGGDKSQLSTAPSSSRPLRSNSQDHKPR